MEAFNVEIDMAFISLVKQKKIQRETFSWGIEEEEIWLKLH